MFYVFFAKCLLLATQTLANVRASNKKHCVPMLAKTIRYLYFCRISTTAHCKNKPKKKFRLLTPFLERNAALFERRVAWPANKRDEYVLASLSDAICSWRGTLHKVLNSHRILTIHFIGFSTFLSKPSQKLHQMEDDGKRRGEWWLFVVFHNKIVILVFPDLIRVHFNFVKHVTAIQEVK